MEHLLTKLIVHRESSTTQSKNLLSSLKVKRKIKKKKDNCAKNKLVTVELKFMAVIERSYILYYSIRKNGEKNL